MTKRSKLLSDVLCFDDVFLPQRACLFDMMKRDLFHQPFNMFNRRCRLYSGFHFLLAH